MADRFPLILNTSANQIQEIASGDTLDLSGNNIKGVGIITATNISGNIIAGAGTSNIVAGIVTAVTYKGDGDFVELDVDGHTNLDNVSIAGVTTAFRIRLEDNRYLQIGNNSDLQLYHDGTNSYIGEGGTGSLFVSGSAVRMQSDDNRLNDSSGNVIIKTDSNTAYLYYNGVGPKLQTTSGGILINGAANIENNGSNIVVGGLGINATIFHNGDENTGMDFSDNDRVRFRTGGVERLAITNGGVHINVGVTTIAQELDVDGHTNLDNVNIAGVTTTSGVFVITAGTQSTNTTTGALRVAGGVGVVKNVNVGGDLDVDGQIQVGTNNSKFGNNYLRFENAGIGYFDHNGTGQNINFRVSNSSSLDTTPLVVKAAGIDVTGNITATGNISVGGVLTYEDVTNVDSVGIVTARDGVFIPDNKELKIGNTAASPDLKIYHDTSDSIIHQDGTGDLRIRSDNNIEFNTNGTQNAIWCDSGAAVKLYYNNGLKFKTTNIGAQIDTILTCYGAAGNPGRLRLQEGGALSEILGTRNSDANSDLQFKTERGDGTQVRAKIDFSGNFIPGTDSTYDLGTSGYRWSNVYTDAINVAGTATISGGTNSLSVTHTGGNCVNFNRSGKTVGINANYAAGNSFSDINLTSGMDLKFSLGGGHKIVFKSAGHIEPETDSQINLGSSSKRFTALWADYVEAYNFGSNGVYSGKFGRIRIGADVYGNTIKTEADNNLNITVPHSVYFNTDANSNGSDAGTSRLRIYSGGIVPTSDKAVDLGSTSIAWRNVYTDNVVTTTALSNRNVIHNGTMFVAQRGTSQSGVNSSGYVRTADRWKLEANGSNVGTYTVSRSTDNPGEFGYSFKIQCTTAHSSLANNEMYEFVQYIEGRNVQRFNKGNSAAKPFALSFSVKTNKTGTYAVLLLDHQHSRMCCANYTVSNTGWNRYEIVFPADTTGEWTYSTTYRLSVKFCLLTGGLFQGGTLQTTWGAATNSNSRVGHNVNLADTVGNTFYITGVQLEAASACTPYEHKDYTEVVRECQRYLYTTPILGAGVWNSAQSFFTACHVPVPMRVHPTVTTNSGNFSNINIEHTDTYGVNSFTNPSVGHGNPNSTAAQSYSGYSSFIIGLGVSYSIDENGRGGLVVCDAASDYFILDAQL